MIKLKLKGNGEQEIELNQKGFSCDFCGLDKECFLAREVTVETVIIPTLKYEHVAILSVHKHFKPSFFGSSYYRIPESDDLFEYIKTGEVKKEIKFQPAICRDCVSQLSKM